MNPVRRIEGRSAALRLENLDTDQIMPKQFLRGIDKQGLRQGLFHDLRFDGEGRERPGFVLNQPAYAGVSVLIGGNNFGCGSSREHAVWACSRPASAPSSRRGSARSSIRMRWGTGCCW